MAERISDARTMRALAHPARIEIIDHLTATGESVTATECAELVGLSPSATSYHLRELAKYGLVEHAPGRGDGRERRWQAVNATLSFAADTDAPDSMAAEHALVDLYLSRDRARIQEWMSRQATEPELWREASALMGQQILVTAEELTELNQKVRALTEVYRLRDRRGSAPDGARHVVVQYVAFPKE
ncbi:helix-turn-helix domain-containing protein [Actinoplanes derwentensis]|uniref:Helix-turn-helix domain-containing protein n=1 Tax=Actinoplanes derwentensis TaxID=113562 RepID=A0A1H2CQD3_9ACTN|nr:helix-turn-helix domain-containing protein [Actinoplanes derwentensis]GID83816.1 transcriptional regulator [Actinoplanes derwentensis]SDT72703.1 Helix-turn-helix domain-containing protein [Actinoplanes derwentensis]